MEISYIKNEIEDKYLLRVETIEKVKNSYKIKTNDGDYGIKVIKYQHPHFYFIFSAIDHLRRRGFKKMPEIIMTKDNLGYISLGNKFAYLNKWIESKSCNYKNSMELKLASETLGELHNFSEGFTLSNNMRPRIAWFSWINVFETRCEEILDFKRRIYQKAYKSQFDDIYLGAIEEELDRGKRAIDEIKNSKYIELMNKEILKRGFCHHDYAHHNVLMNKNNEVNIIDFDYCILDTHIHDLASLLIRVMKDGGWSNEVANLILDSYANTHSLFNDEVKLMKGFIRFPQGFWQIGLQYYWEQQPWGEEFLINKLTKYLGDREKREEFLESFIY
ncbi:CotS family spore coat protein [Clostridium sp. AL.422]|uniref:CotS family spore coat protein n=1 Tax=Clostridium TaxID=1485 RepID=UPI00293DFF57|nr:MULTISPECIES: CotS family spore coat protein [unclassified Clostridium]MDV4149514.1 CotS family spore coat protein [Clostridium sp. AL.422]